MVKLKEKSYMYPMDVVAVTAVPMNSDDCDRLSTVLEKKLGTTVKLVNEIDKNVIAGVLLKIEGKRFDGTYRGELKSMKRTLMDAQLHETEVWYAVKKYRYEFNT